MKKIIIILIALFTLSGCKNPNYMIIDNNKYYFHLNEENNKYLEVETYHSNMYIEFELNYPDYPELEIPEGLSEKEIDSLKWNYNNQIYIYYRSKNDEILNQYGILDLDNEDLFISGYDRKINFTSDLNYYHKMVENIINQMKSEGVIDSFSTKETYDVVSATRINPDFYNLKKSDKIKIGHSYPSIYIGLNEIKLKEYMYPVGIFFSKEELKKEYDSRESATSLSKYYASRLEEFDFEHYVYIISELFDKTNTEEYSYSIKLNDLYLVDDTFYSLYQKVTRPNTSKATTISSSHIQIIARINKVRIKENKNYKFVDLY